MAQDRIDSSISATASARELSIRVTKASPQECDATISLSGCLDAQTADMLHLEVTRCVHGGIKNFIFDLPALLYLSSSGIDWFTHALKLVRPRGGDVILAGATERVRGVISMYGFESTFRAVADVDAAFQVLPRLRDRSSPDSPFRASWASCGQDLTVSNPEPLTCGGRGVPLRIRVPFGNRSLQPLGKRARVVGCPSANGEAGTPSRALCHDSSVCAIVPKRSEFAAGIQYHRCENCTRVNALSGQKDAIMES